MPVSGLVPLGNVTPGANGSIPLLTAFPALSRYPIQSVHAILFQAHESNVDKTFVGDLSLNVVSDVGVIYVMVAPTDSFIPGIAIDCSVSQDAIPLHQIALGAYNANDRIRVSVLTA